jgi:hypothetical protein
MNSVERCALEHLSRLNAAERDALEHKPPGPGNARLEIVHADDDVVIIALFLRGKKRFQVDVHSNGDLRAMPIGEDGDFSGSGWCMRWLLNQLRKEKGL